MVVNRQATMYSEVYGILNMLGNDYKNSIPKQILNLIEDKRFKDYTPKYNVSIPLWKQNISKGATEFICMLHYNYWIKSEDEKNEIDNILTNNQKKKDEYLKGKYNPDNIFKNNTNIEEAESTDLIEYKEPVIKKIINKILKILHIKNVKKR